MNNEMQAFVEGMQKPIAKMGIKELRQREELWRSLFSWIDDEVKYYIMRVGSLVRIMKRDYKGTLGELGSVKFKMDEIELRVYEKTYNYQDGKYYYEDKVIKLPASAIAMQEFIISQENVEEEELSISPLDEVEDLVT